MNHNITEHRSRDGRTPTSIRLLQNPIDFIAEDHLRLRAMCAELDRLADAERPETEALEEMQEYLAHELPALLNDEDLDVLPMLLDRAEPEDELPSLARRLGREHREIEGCLGFVLDLLAASAPAAMASSSFRQALRDLARVTRRHLILENAVLLPLARVRLTDADLVALRQAMLRRRGLQDLFVA
ncbi:hemerythrin domain-containing protein [Roseibacterium beibuensis]|uniref:Hemerythrin-like domain-containing protein n=1 Tax=[Roseibacterium] beibuensis TaxID=1193142 RepID=A0ABP9LJW4_9RHOB|nr:hemerythrin domain-containing protein [Roseibacterium beibuensis]MCS6623343.1 hemerythrin domain-containing protein [Roseibacterium beibuensis]